MTCTVYRSRYYFRFVGINASDINYTSGRYDATVKPPFDVGFEVTIQITLYCKYTDIN